MSNVRYWLDEPRIRSGATTRSPPAVFQLAKRSDHTLTDAEILAEIDRVQSVS